jgi:hypothetical protein
MSETVLSILLALVLPNVAHASSPAAWADLFERAERSCHAASQLREPTTLGQVVDFSQHVLVTVQGTWPQPHMNGEPAVFECLYRKADGVAEARERL